MTKERNIIRDYFSTLHFFSTLHIDKNGSFVRGIKVGDIFIGLTKIFFLPFYLLFKILDLWIWKEKNKDK